MIYTVYESNYFFRKKRSLFDLFALGYHVLSGKICVIDVVCMILYANTKCCCQILCHWRNIMSIKLTILLLLSDEQTHCPLSFCPRRWCNTGFPTLADGVNVGAVHSAVLQQWSGKFYWEKQTAGFRDGQVKTGALCFNYGCVFESTSQFGQLNLILLSAR